MVSSGPHVRTARTVSRWATILAMGMGCLVLLGWVLNVPLLERLAPGLAPMQVSTALGIVLASLVLWILNDGRAKERAMLVAQVCAVAVLLIGLLTLVEDLGTPLPSTFHLSYRYLSPHKDLFTPSSMAEMSALSFVMLGVALWLFSRSSRYVLADILALLVMVMADVTLASYIYGIASYRAMISSTSGTIALLLCSTAALLARPDHGLMAAITSDSAGGFIGRRLLPAVWLIPLIIGAIEVTAEEKGLISLQLGSILDIFATIVPLAIMVWWMASVVNETDVRRVRAENSLKRYAQRLEILHQIDLGIIAAQSIQEIIEATLGRLRELVPCQWANVLVIDKATSEAVVFAVDNHTKMELIKGTRIPIVSDFYERLDRKQVRVFDDIRTSPDLGPRAEQLVKEGLVSLLQVTLLDRDDPIGLLGLAAEAPGFFTVEYQEIVSQVAGQITVAIRQLKLSQELARYTNQLEQRVSERTAELSHAKQRVEGILNNSTDGILLAHTDLTIQQTNMAIDTLFGSGAGEFVDRSLLDLIHSDDAHQVLTTAHRAIEERSGKHIEIRCRRKNVSIFQAQISLRYFDTEDEDTRGFVCTIQDITDRKQNEEALRESEERFRSLINAAPVAIVISDQIGRITLVNEQTESLFGYSAEELLGRPVEILVPEYLRQRHSWHRAGYVAEPTVRKMGIGLELTALRKDGSSFPTEIELSFINTKAGLLIISFVMNIAERKQAEISLREQRDFLEQIINNVPDLIMVKDRNGRFQLVNMPVAQSYNTLPANMLGKVLGDFAPESETGNAYLLQKDREAMDSGQRVVIPEHFFLERYYQTTKTPLKNRNGEYDRVLAVSSDITHRKNAEEILRGALEKEHELGELKSRFVSMASHEFRTPLATILATSETLTAYRHKMPDEQIDQRLGKIREQVSHLKTIMEDVLQLAQMQAQRVLFNPVRLDLDAICRSLVDEFQSRPDVKHQIIYRCDEILRDVFLDKKLMRQIISNLLSNAIKYSPVDKPVIIDLAYSDGSLVLSVKDEGIGIPEADLNHLFEPFHRAVNVGTISGTGLGLTITREAVELHGGTISVESQLDVGTALIVRIPVKVNGEITDVDNSGH